MDYKARKGPDRMQNKHSILTQAGICFGIIMANFIAQIPYFFHLYFQIQSLSIDIRSFIIMGAVFAVFMSGAVLLFKPLMAAKNASELPDAGRSGQRAGYWIMIVFLLTEFLFYLFNVIGSVLHGFSPFFQISNPDLILRIIYSIGYLNLFGAGYFLFLLLYKKGIFLGGVS
jgi:hypothetical protein